MRERGLVGGGRAAARRKEGNAEMVKRTMMFAAAVGLAAQGVVKTATDGEMVVIGTATIVQ